MSKRILNLKFDESTKYQMMDNQINRELIDQFNLIKLVNFIRNKQETHKINYLSTLFQTYDDLNIVLNALVLLSNLTDNDQPDSSQLVELMSNLLLYLIESQDIQINVFLKINNRI